VGKRKVTILQPVVEEIARIALFIESEGFPQTAKKFVNEAFYFFEQLSDEHLTHRPCKFIKWQLLNYRCVNFRKKYVIAYLDNTDEIVLCDFALQKLLQD
jgi:hypothetical protein